MKEQEVFEARNRFRRADQWALTTDNDGNTLLFDMPRPALFVRVAEEWQLKLFFAFDSRRSATIAEAVDTWTRRNPIYAQIAISSVHEVLNLFLRARIVVSDGCPNFEYTPEMARWYLRARTVPPEVCLAIRDDGDIRSTSRVLDIGTGTGEIALALSQYSTQVVGIDVSETLLAIAKERAMACGANISWKLMSASRLVFERMKVDVAIAAQMFHWSNAFWLSEGIVRSLKPSGSFFAVESKPVLPKGHPLREMFGFGAATHRAAIQLCEDHARWYAERFRSYEPFARCLMPATVRIFREVRPFDFAFARAYFFDEQISAVQGSEPDPWQRLRAAYGRYDVSTSNSCFYWVMIQLAKGKTVPMRKPFHLLTKDVVEIPCSARAFFSGGNVLDNPETSEFSSCI